MYQMVLCNLIGSQYPTFIILFLLTSAVLQLSGRQMRPTKNVRWPKHASLLIQLATKEFLSPKFINDGLRGCRHVRHVVITIYIFFSPFQINPTGFQSPNFMWYFYSLVKYHTHHCWWLQIHDRFRSSGIKNGLRNAEKGEIPH